MKHNIGIFAVDSNIRPHAQMVELAHNMGFSTVELYHSGDLATPDLAVAKGIAAKADELGMDICCISLGADFMDADQKGQVQWVKDYIHIAEIVGAKYMHFTTFPVLHYDTRGICMNKMVRTIAPAVRELCDYAAERNIQCVSEEQGFYMNGIEPLAQLIEEVDHPNFGIVADLGNSLCVDVAPEQFLGYFAPVVRHVHVKDMVYQPQPDPSTRCLQSRGGYYLHKADLGSGVVDIEKCLQILASVGYDGAFCLENTVLDRMENVTNDRQYLQNLLNKTFG